MARLNEPPIAPAPSAETVDAVKRRFLRQNRELAKTNSQQSIRIRSLENDASRLLAENLSLREQVLQLQNALETQANRPSFENIDSVKDRLEAKIQELGGLVAELGQLKTQNRSPRCKSQTAATRRSPDERQWRSGLGLQEVENAMLPTIVEDKYYPRRTMCADDIQAILDAPDSQSPDIGPPPVSRFENENPIAFNPNSPPEEEQEDRQEESRATLPVNLETRRRRRESGGRENVRRVSLFESPPEESQEPAKPVRTGAKRKFSVQEDEEKVQPQETFRFSRRTPTIENGGSKDEARPQSPDRPVLGSKPVNTDPVLSPKKQRSSADKPDKKPLPRTSRSRLTITRNVVPELPPLPIPEPVPTAEINLDSLPPKTPAADDVFSPPSTEPSTARPESKDTPPPGDLTSSETGMGGRPSRRARPQVSYKEPSLNTKMRRPGKELVDAVISDSRRTSVEPQSVSSTATVGFKQELGDSAWKPVGSVTGRAATEDGEMGSPLRQKLDRREESLEKPGTAPEPPKLNSSAASNAISALINETSIAKRKLASSAKPVSESSDSQPEPRETTNPPPPKPEPKDDLAIFDFNESSPADSSARSRFDLAKAARNARRHSSVPAVPATEDRKPDKRPETTARPEGALPSVHKRTGSGGIKSSSTTSLGKPSLSLGKSTATARASSEKKISALPASNSSMDLRAERAASRRKSMML